MSSYFTKIIVVPQYFLKIYPAPSSETDAVLVVVMSEVEEVVVAVVVVLAVVVAVVIAVVVAVVVGAMLRP